MDQAGHDWLIATLVRRGDGLFLGVRGQPNSPRVDQSVRLPRTSPFQDLGTIRVAAHEALLDRVRTAGPAGITLYLDVRARLDLLPVEAIVSAFLRDQSLEIGNVRLSRLARRPWERRRGFRLPLRVAGLGQWDRTLDDVIDAKPWAQAARDDGGLFMGLPELNESALDVLIAGGDDLGTARQVLAPQGIGAASRLLVVVDDGASALMPYMTSAFPLQPGLSMLVIPEQSGGRAATLGALFDELTHDHSFDELAQLLSTPEKSAVLVTDPVATHALRMSDAASALVDQAADINRSIIDGSPVRLLSQVEEPRLRTAIRRAGELGFASSQLVSQAMRQDISFFAETRGFVPLAQARRKLEDAREAVEQTKALLSTVDDEAQLLAIEQAQGRVVNMSLQRTGYRTMREPMVAAWEALERQAPYRLFVGIGERTPHSLVAGDPPAIDPLLPELESGGRHILHVAVYTEDFRVDAPEQAGPVDRTSSSPSATEGGPQPPFVQRLELPRVGPSAPVEFVVTPITANARAEARISIYYDASPADEDVQPPHYRNHLVQSFVLTANLADTDALQAGIDAGGVTVVLDMSQTERFANLATLKPRLLSIALNDGPGEGTHRLMLKQGAEASDVQFSEGQMQSSLAGIRDLLRTLCWNDANDGPRFPVEQAADGALSETFVHALSALARAGLKLYDLLRLKLDQTHGAAMMRAVRDSSGEVIQVMRLDLSYYFPWTLIYDFKKPKANAPVCDGFRRQKASGEAYSCADCLAACLHPDKSEAYCAYGFWGARHQIEQLVGGVTARDTVSTLQPVGDGAVHVAVGLEGGELGGLVSHLRLQLKHLPTGWITEAPAGENLLRRLRKPIGRPVILLVASHCEAVDDDEWAPALRIQLPGSDEWLETSDLLEEALEHSPWRTPQPLVVLAACGSAAADLAALSDFVGSFLDAGASAVVGTEAVIFEDLAVAFATRFTPEMLDGKTLGGTILDFRQELLRQETPLGFLFTAYGPADLATALSAAPQVTQLA